MNILTLNINGLRTKRKKTLLGKMLKDLQIGVCVLTETHLRKSDLEQIDYPQYSIIADHCRPTPEGEWIKGGVLILVHINFTAEELPKQTELLPVIENCACTVYPTADPITAIDIVGV